MQTRGHFKKLGNVIALHPLAHIRSFDLQRRTRVWEWLVRMDRNLRPARIYEHLKIETRNLP